MDIQLLKKLPLGRNGNRFINNPIEIITKDNLSFKEFKILRDLKILIMINIRKKL